MRAAVVGATDGIGRALCEELTRRGWHVAVVGRDSAKVEGVVTALDERPEAPPGSGRAVGVVCDVTDPSAVDRAFDETLERLGQLDLLIYSAGVMPPADTLRRRIDGAGPILDVNVRGAVHWLELAAGYMEEAGSGTLVAVGSVAGERGRKGHPVYCAGKAALTEYMEGLRHRLHGRGVRVVTVKPGWVRTRMLDARLHGSAAAVDPAAAARAIVVRGVEKGRESFFVPRWWGLVAFALRLTPRSLFKRFAPP